MNTVMRLARGTLWLAVGRSRAGNLRLNCRLPMRVRERDKRGKTESFEKLEVIEKYVALAG